MNMSSPGEKKRKAGDDGDRNDPSDPSPMSRQTPKKLKAKTAIQTGDAHTRTIGNRYFYDNCTSLYQQHVEMLNQEFQTFLRNHPLDGQTLDQMELNNPNVNRYWYVCEYLRRLVQLKSLYQSPFVGKVLTCGLADTASLGYEQSTTRPKLVRSFDLKIVKLSSGSTFTIMSDIDGKVYTFGGQDEGGMGRGGEDYEGDLQVRGFIPSTPTPIANEDSCIVKVVGGYSKSLALSIHGNLYVFGCHRDYQETFIRERPMDVTVADIKGKKFPFGFNSTPVQVSVPVPVVDMATGGFGSAAIGEDGNVYTWGTGTTGELGRPLSRDHLRDQDPNSEGRYYVDFIVKEMIAPAIVPAIQGKVAISVACGQGHLMVVVRERGHLESTVYGSGLNRDGQLGLGDKKNRMILTPLTYTKDEQMMIKEVKAGMFHTLALSLDGKRLYACGKNDYGQCGISGVVSSPGDVETKLKLVQFPNNDLEIDEISCGEQHNLAIAKARGGHRQVYTWGSTVPAEDACCLGHGEEDRNEYRPRELVLTRKNGERVEGGVWRQASGGSQHSTFLFTSAPKSK